MTKAWPGYPKGPQDDHILRDPPRYKRKPLITNAALACLALAVIPLALAVVCIKGAYDVGGGPDMTPYIEGAAWYIVGAAACILAAGICQR